MSKLVWFSPVIVAIYNEHISRGLRDYRAASCSHPNGDVGQPSLLPQNHRPSAALRLPTKLAGGVERRRKSPERLGLHSCLRRLKP